ncbi:MAG: hypothetical protein UV38_C0003G0147 [candidate division TM6 bacterium GW2011_GWE2_42_60]|nr:MAG: hypothetical protein UV38_C0003G0147 [candidate division TM6 bacterium GW2011_GWE2_42_60]HBY05376.1 hypothetical protein [Candidatus Dependentiae bacterium]
MINLCKKNISLILCLSAFSLVAFTIEGMNGTEDIKQVSPSELNTMWIKNLSSKKTFPQKYKVMEFCLKNGLNPNSLSTPNTISCSFTPLTSAFAYLYEDSGDSLQNPDNKVKKFTETPCFKTGQIIQVLALLLQNGAKLNLPDNSGQTALRRAIKKGDQEIVDYLIQCKALVSDQDEMFASANKLQLFSTRSLIKESELFII